MPLIGEMPAKGLAIHEFRESIARKLSDGYLKNPKVTVEMLNYRPIFVHGEVKNGGEFAYKTALTVRRDRHGWRLHLPRRSILLYVGRDRAGRRRPNARRRTGPAWRQYPNP
jgi:hypothetical protein